MSTKKRILLKISGKVFKANGEASLNPITIKAVINQIKLLSQSHQFAIVIGGGNILRGEDPDTQLVLTPVIGHQAGMLATIINGLILKDLCDQRELSAVLLSALVCPQISNPISPNTISEALQKNQMVIFAGGTGNPFFTTDTNAVLRSLQVGATEIWKATSVDGIYNSDPVKNANAKLIKKINYRNAIEKKLGVMDMTAFILAQKHERIIKIFNIFAPNSLLMAAENSDFGSIITFK